MAKIISIIGATGLQGASVVDTFLALPGWHVRGITRNPSSPAAQALSEKGVELFKADIDDSSSLNAAFEGASVIFANTDFFEPFFRAMDPSNVPEGTNPKAYAYDIEVKRGANIAKAAASPAVLKTLDRFIWSSLPDATKWSRGKITTAYHYDSKAEVIRQIHQQFPDLAPKLSMVQLGFYIQNWKGFQAMVPRKQADGSFLIARPVKPTDPFLFVDPRQDTGPVVKALVDLPAGKTIFAVSETMTWPDFTSLWGQVNGVKASYKQVSDEEFWTGAPPALAEEIKDAWDFAGEFGFHGGDPDVLMPSQVDPPIKMTSLEDIIKGQDWSSVF